MIMTHGRVYICFFKLFYLLSVFLVLFTRALQPREPQLSRNKTGRLTAAQLTRDPGSDLRFLLIYIYKNQLYTVLKLYHWLK
jgi:hypothetical protein